MASAAVSEDEDEKTCSVCHEYFSQPKILTCGHLLCRRCLISWLQTQDDAACPLCRCAIVEPEEKANRKILEDVADTFPTDLSMKVWVESQQLLGQDHACQACVSQAASSICTTCRDLLCASCATVHNKMSMLRHHTVEKLTSLTPEQLAATHPSFCSTHGGEISKVYCPKHGASVCWQCAATEHRQCPEMTSLETRMKEARAALADMRSTLRTKEAHLVQAVQQLDRHLQDMEVRVKVTTAEIEAMCDRLDSAVKACRQRLKDLLDNAFDDIRQAVSDAKTSLRQRQGRLTIHDAVVQRVETGLAFDVVHGMASNLKTRIGDMDGSSTLPSDAKAVNVMELVIDQQAVARLEKELSQLGQLRVVPGECLAQPVKVQPLAMACVEEVPFQLGQLEAELPGCTVQPAAFSFHDKKKGTNIVLSNNLQTAEGTSGISYNGIVLSCEPMQVNSLYQVRVDKTFSAFNSSYIFLGVVTENPDTVILPNCSWYLTSAVVVTPFWVKENGTETSSQVGSSLCNVREGGCVGLTVNDERTLRLYLDGQCLGVVASGVADPCYFMVDLVSSWRKVTALPVRPMP